MSNSALSSYVILALCAVMVPACELFVVGGRRAQPVVIDRSQGSSVGVVQLWKAELDTHNLTAVTELMRHSTGRPLLAVERHEMRDDLERWYAILKPTPLTIVAIDTVSSIAHRVRMQTREKRAVVFHTLLDQNRWFVTSVE